MTRAMRYGSAAAAMVAAIGAVAACGSEPTACPDVRRLALSPRDTTVQVGQQFRARLYVGGGCLSTGLTDASWTSSDPTVLAVDALTGLATAVAPGDATISAVKHGQRQGDVRFGSITVHVGIEPAIR